jgi:hypothetical protein
MDLLINQISVLSGDVHWDPKDDVEHFASFCSEECMLSYIAQQLGIEDDQADSSTE